MPGPGGVHGAIEGYAATTIAEDGSGDWTNISNALNGDLDTHADLSYLMLNPAERTLTISGWSGSLGTALRDIRVYIYGTGTLRVYPGFTSQISLHVEYSDDGAVSWTPYSSWSQNGSGTTTWGAALPTLAQSVVVLNVDPALFQIRLRLASTGDWNGGDADGELYAVFSPANAVSQPSMTGFM